MLSACTHVPGLSPQAASTPPLPRKLPLSLQVIPMPTPIQKTYAFDLDIHFLRCAEGVQSFSFCLGHKSDDSHSPQEGPVVKFRMQSQDSLSLIELLDEATFSVIVYLNVVGRRGGGSIESEPLCAGTACVTSWHGLHEGEDCLCGASELSLQYIHFFKREEAQVDCTQYKGTSSTCTSLLFHSSCQSGTYPEV